ncbi:hypothetical protein D7D54_09175 [Streptococcus chosunense]|uniref:Uncharacterized protein n=1 Tax=Streptococcus chosunensis TaxID=2707003 RepID=A0A3B0BF42_9STRE|nr:hypothetical protein D7D54_09175 [Streptococcus chosunense]
MKSIFSEIMDYYISP